MKPSLQPTGLSFSHLDCNVGQAACNRQQRQQQGPLKDLPFEKSTHALDSRMLGLRFENDLNASILLSTLRGVVCG